MEKFHIIIALFLLAFAGGCFSLSSPRPVRTWYVASQDEKIPRQGAVSQAFKTTRLGNVSVSAPFDKSSIAVLRQDGTIAYDAYNVFASAPASLLRQPVKRILSNDGRFGQVVPQNSIASASAVVEVSVVDFSLDCRQTGKRTAKVEVELSVVKSGNGSRTVAASSSGQGEADASGGDYTGAFTSAFGKSVENALGNLVLAK